MVENSCFLTLFGGVSFLVEINSLFFQNVSSTQFANLFSWKKLTWSYQKYLPDFFNIFSILFYNWKTHVFPIILLGHVFCCSKKNKYFERLFLNPVCQLFIVEKTLVFYTKKSFRCKYVFSSLLWWKKLKFFQLFFDSCCLLWK